MIDEDFRVGQQIKMELLFEQEELEQNIEELLQSHGEVIKIAKDCK